MSSKLRVGGYPWNETSAYCVFNHTMYPMNVPIPIIIVIIDVVNGVIGRID